MRAVAKAASAWLSKGQPPIAGCVTGNFSRDRRIVKTDDFSSVFRLRPRKRTAHFVFYARSNQLPHARLGVVVAKRLAPRAVTRNMIKRLCRESFRLASLPAIDCIVRLSSPVNDRSKPAATTGLKKQLREELHQLFPPKVIDRKSL